MAPIITAANELNYRAKNTVQFSQTFLMTGWIYKYCLFVVSFISFHLLFFCYFSSQKGSQQTVVHEKPLSGLHNQNIYRLEQFFLILFVHSTKTPKQAVFAGSMQLLAGIKLCTGRVLTNHPHYEDKDLRERTRQVLLPALSVNYQSGCEIQHNTEKWSHSHYWL